MTTTAEPGTAGEAGPNYTDAAGTKFTPESVRVLEASAIPPECWEQYGIRSVQHPDHVPDEIDRYWVMNGGPGQTGRGPGMLFEWRDRDRTVYQFRPDKPVVDSKGETHKYILPKGCGTFLSHWREGEPDEPVLVIEGTKQAIAGAVWAPHTWGIVAVPGCNGWVGTDTTWAEDRKVIVLFDADVDSNRDVYDAAVKFKDALEADGAVSVAFAKLAGARAKEGLDDVLGRRPADKRTDYLVRICDKAVTKLGRRPTRRSTDEPEGEPPNLNGRVAVSVNLDRRMVIDQIMSAIQAKWDGTELFNFGGALTRLYEAATEPLEQGAFLELLTHAVAAYHYTEPMGNKPAKYAPAWPDSQTVKAVMSQARRFKGLDRVVHAPFVRKDGTVCDATGYDEASRTWVELEEGLTVSVPEDPTAEDVESARKLLMEDWLGDMPFPTDADRAGALALIITPFVRDRVDLAPQAVISGVQMGVGKNLLVECLSLLVLGRTVEPYNLPSENEELRKTITAVLRSASSLVVWDEAHVIQGKALAMALTAEKWSDRVLGVSEVVSIPNRATWVSMGNNVQVNADCARRVHWIELRPSYKNPQDRPADTFRHPNLKEWTRENRPALLSAVLTLIRAWYLAGCPYTPRSESFGSFGVWERTVGGILQTAGQPGFLDGLREKRVESDFVGGVWVEHLSWLVSVFGADKFSAAQVRDAASAPTQTAEAFVGGGGFLAPPGLEDVGAAGWVRSLGNAYRSVLNQNRGGMTLVKVGQGHNNVALYAVQVDGTDEENADGGSGGTGGSPYPQKVAQNEEAPTKTSKKPDFEASTGGVGGVGGPSTLKRLETISSSKGAPGAAHNNAFLEVEGGQIPPLPPLPPTQEDPFAAPAARKNRRPAFTEDDAVDFLETADVPAPRTESTPAAPQTADLQTEDDDFPWGDFQ